MRFRNPAGAICIGPPAQTHVHDLDELHEQFRLAVARIRGRPHLVQSFFAQAGLTIEILDGLCAAVSIHDFGGGVLG
jgi:hypothetical protein